MLIRTPQELRLFFPSHAFDSIDGLVGFIDNSEHDFLLQPLGLPLYGKLCEWYDQNAAISTDIITSTTIISTSVKPFLVDFIGIAPNVVECVELPVRPRALHVHGVRLHAARRPAAADRLLLQVLELQCVAAYLAFQH